MPADNFTELSDMVANLTSSEAFEKAMDEATAALPNIEEILKAQGLDLPEGAELTIRITIGARPQEIEAATKGDKCRICWDVCAGPPWARVCREKCRWTKC